MGEYSLVGAVLVRRPAAGMSAWSVLRRRCRLISPLVYFIFHHVNRVLELPIRMKEVLANTGWAQIRENLEKFDEGGLNEKLDKEEAEASTVSNQNKWTDMTMELTARQNFELLQSRVREARKRRDAAVHR